MSDSANIARHLPAMAARLPDHAAIKVARGRTSDGQIDYLTLSFRELNGEVDAWATRLADKGVVAGDRVLVMVRQGLPLIAAAFALFKLGAVPVIIDPGMGRKNFLTCVARSKPRVLLGIPLAQLTSHLFRRAFASVEIRVWAPGAVTGRLQARGATPSRRPPVLVESARTDLAAILFTSGSTGAPKGVCYEHGMFDAQVRLVRDAYGIQAGEVDLPMLPIFALFNPALGMTTIVPELDPSRPAAADPAKLVQAIQQEHVTNSFGSPTLWRKIFDYCLANEITLPSLKRVLCAGAAVPASLWADARRVLPHGQLHSPYGATEALPVASLAAGDFVAPTATGTLLGMPLPRNRVKIIAPHDGPITRLGEIRELPRGEVGEIIVTGPSVTKSYDGLPEATARTKIAGQHPDGSPVVWHRMGDAGFLDDAGRLWFCGRLVEGVTTPAGVLHTEPVEQVFRAHPQVVRCALIGLGEPGHQQPALVVQARSPLDRETESALARELHSLGQKHAASATIHRFFFHRSLPVDVRHNAKIHRLTLARWAAGEKGHAID